MDDRSIRHLNRLNRDFYERTVEDFDESRGRAWNGWKRLLPLLPLVSPLRVLDAGCGNGRLGRFLARHLGRPLTYQGVDHSPALLKAARESFHRHNNLPDAVLESRDLVLEPPPAGSFDLVALMGVLHHVPGKATREALLKSLGEQVAPGGVLVFTTWRFSEYERFRERLLPLPPEIQGEPGDFLMDWRRGHAALTALRYCHYVDDQEQDGHEATLITQGFSLIERFRSDGHTDDINAYSLLRRGLEG